MVLTLNHGINLDSRLWPKAKQGSAEGQKALAKGQKGLDLLVFHNFVTSTQDMKLSFSPTRPSGPSGYSSRKVCLCVLGCPLPMRFCSRPLIGPVIA